MKNLTFLLCCFTLGVLFEIVLHAQTDSSTNTFMVPVTNVVTQPQVTATNPVVQSIVINPAAQKMTIWFVGASKPIVISGDAFTAFQSQFQGQFGTAIAAYLQANPQ